MGLESHAKQVMGPGLVAEIYKMDYVGGQLRYYFLTQYHRNRAYARLQAGEQFNPVKIGKRVLGFRTLKKWGGR